jgi:tRNA-dihydrouridine synthase B
LHARTLKQHYSGKADWDLIKELKEMVNIPVVGNGDIKCPEDAKNMMEQTGCDYVMIGRAAMGNPEIFRQCNDYLKTGKYAHTDAEHKLAYFLKYLEHSKNFHINFSNIKIQAMNFTTGINKATSLRQRISATKNKEEIKRVFEEYSDSYGKY